LSRLTSSAKDPAFRARVRDVKRGEKHRAFRIEQETGTRVDPASLFDVQIKRIR
jgi:starch phosphorylase